VSTYAETFRALRPTTEVVTVRLAQLDLRRGARLALGAIAPLAVGVLLGRIELGVFAALGALPAGFAATTGARARQHASAVLLSALGMACAGFAGAALAGRPWLVLGALVAAAYAAGLCGAFSQRIGIATLQWPVALLLGTSSPSGIAHAGTYAALLLAGGSWQALLTALDTRGEAAARTAPHGAGRRARRAGAVRQVCATLRAGLDPRSGHGQHVLRLTAVAAATHTVALLAGISHGYWAALTALLVLKPEHTTTIRRSLDRIGGTAVGVLFGVPLALVGGAGHGPLLLVAAFTLCLAYTVFSANYFVYCVFLTGFVVLLLDLLGQGAAETALSRLVATVIGGSIALAASHIRPAAPATPSRAPAWSPIQAAAPRRRPPAMYSASHAGESVRG
jgi:uncharacterized membrane protein YccC